MTDTRKIVLRNVRVRYPTLNEARENKLAAPGSKKYFSAQFIISESDSENLANIKAKIAAAFNEKFGAEKGPKVMRAAAENKNTRGLQHDLDNGFWYLNAKRVENRGAPVVFGRDRQEIVDVRDYPQGGDYVDAVIQSWCYDFNGSRGVSFELVSVRFREKGEPFPGQGLKASSDDFEALDSKTASNEDTYGAEAYL